MDIETKIASDPSLQKADLQEAQIHFYRMAATNSHFERHNVWSARVEKHIAHFGVGMQLYFTFLYHLFWVFTGLACLAIPQMVFTWNGNMLEPQAGMSLDMTLLPNIGQAPNIGFGLTTAETLRAFMERTAVIAGNTLSVKSCTMICGVCDVIGVIGVLIWVMWFFKVHTANVVFDNDVRTLDLSDHAIMVTNLPRRISDHHNYRYHLKEHFEEIALNNPDRDHSVDNGDTRIIHEVSLVRDFEGSFKTILNVGDYHREIDCNRARRHWGMDIPESEDEKLEAKMKASLATVMQKDYKQVHARDVVMAFVTFTSQKDKQFVQSQYSSTRFTLSHHLQPAGLRFAGQALSVVTAPEPEDIIWENLDVPYRSRALRTCGIIAVVALILLLAFFLTWIILVGVVTREFHSSKNASVIQVLTRQGPNPWNVCNVSLYTDYDCTEEIPASSYTWQPFMNDDKWTLTMHEDPHDAACYESDVTHLVGENVGFQLVHDSPMNIGCLKLRQDNPAALSKGFSVRMCEEAGNYPAAIGQKVMSCTKAADLFFHEMDTSLQAFSLSSWHERDVDNCDLYDDEGLSTADFLALLQNTKADTDFVDWQANCYCNSNIFKSLLDSSTRKVCHIYIQDSIKAMAVGAASSILVHVINFVLKRTIRYLVKFERPISSSIAMISGFTKVFVAQYLNSAIIALLVHFKWQTRALYLGNIKMTGNYADLSPKWYLDVGHYYMIVSLTYIVFPHILRLMKLPAHHYLRRWRTSKFEEGIQADLDKIWTPPEFKLDVKYANIMSIVFLVFTYYSGVPVMLFFVCCTVLIVYWCDKTEFLWGAARPPFYDETLSNTAVVSPPVLDATLCFQSCIPLGLLLHCCAATQMYGHPVVSPGWWAFGIEDWFLRRIDDIWKSSEVVPSYFYKSPVGYFSWSWWSVLTPVTLFSTSSIFHTLLAVAIGCGIAIAIMGLIMVMSGIQVPERVMVFGMQYVDNVAVDYADDTLIDEVQYKLSQEDRVVSYYVKRNPKYDMVHKAILWLETHKDLVDHDGEDGGASQFYDDIFFVPESESGSVPSFETRSCSTDSEAYTTEYSSS